MSRGARRAAQHRGGAAPLSYTGQVVGRDDDGREVVTVQHDGDGWRVVVHGTGVNDDGVAYTWQRQDLGRDGHPVLHASLDDALAGAGGLVPRFEEEHAAADERRRTEEALAAISAGLPPYEAYTVEQLRAEATRRGLEGFARLAKGGLVALLEDDDANAKED